METKPEWHVVAVAPRGEKRVAAALLARGYEAFVPVKACTYDGRSRVKYVPIWSSYVFCRFGNSERLMIAGTPLVRHVVCVGKSPIVPIVVPEDAIRSLKAISASTYPVECGEPYYAVRDYVSVESGGESLRGLLVSRGPDCRVAVNIDALNCSVVVRVPHDAIKPVR